MDELPVSGPEPVSTDRLFLRRLGCFAGAHFYYSVSCFFVCCFLVYLMGLALLSSVAHPPEWLLEALFSWLSPLALVLGYIPLGYWFGGQDVWPLPLRGRDLALSVLVEAAVAWGWAALVTGAMAAENEDLLILLFFPSLFLAFPSSVFVWMGAGILGLAGLEDPVWTLVYAGFWAGLLPPLLFHLGSYWRAWRAAK